MFSSEKMHPGPLARFSRRDFSRRLVQTGAMALAARGGTWARQAPAVVKGSAPSVVNGVMSGDVSAEAAVIWSRTDRPARMVVEWSTTASFSDPRRVVGPMTGPEAEFTAKTILSGLPAGQRIQYRVRFEDPDGRTTGEPALGELVTAPRDSRDVFFAWSGDTCGQGFGTSPDRRGMKTYAAIRDVRPDFFVHSGDTIYADNPIGPGFKFADGTSWQNLVLEEKSKVAETLAEFRAAHRYNLEDEHVRAFNATVPVFAQWDDHEVRNNWYPGQKLLDDPRYREKDVNVLADRARQAFFDYQPVRPSADRVIYRNVPRGPHCELFFLDLRSYRGANSPNRQTERSAESAFLGETQLAWLKRSLAESRSTWKIICSDMPLALLVSDGATNWEAFANGENGAPLGRELEVADLLRFLKTQKIRNVIWLTADVHYAASHHYDPIRAAFTEFDPFWEFVSGPLHAGTFGPNPLDRTFGAEARWTSRTPGAVSSGPYTSEQFFGTVRIDGKSGVATVTHFNRDGKRLWSIELPPAA